MIQQKIFTLLPSHLSRLLLRTVRLLARTTGDRRCLGVNHEALNPFSLERPIQLLCAKE